MLSSLLTQADPKLLGRVAVDTCASVSNWSTPGELDSILVQYVVVVCFVDLGVSCLVVSCNLRLLSWKEANRSVLLLFRSCMCFIWEDSDILTAACHRPLFLAVTLATFRCHNRWINFKQVWITRYVRHLPPSPTYVCKFIHVARESDFVKRYIRSFTAFEVHLAGLFHEAVRGRDWDEENGL